MSIVFPKNARTWLESTLETAFENLVISPMKGGTSSAILRIQRLDAPGREFVLRVPDCREWVAEEPELAAHEAAALKYAQQAKLRAPRLVAYSEEEIGFGAPVLLMTKLEGKVELQPQEFSIWLRSLAAELAMIHQNDGNGFPWEYESWVEPQNLFVPEWATDRGCWERAFAVWRAGQPEYLPVFLHRDYHPVNVLWNGNKLSGVVDWPSACRGPAGVDVGHCRINLAQMYGVEAADRFLEYYRERAADFVYHPYWDLDTVFDWCIPEPEYYAPWRMFGLEEFPNKVLRERIEEYLSSICRRFLEY